MNTQHLEEFLILARELNCTIAAQQAFVARATLIEHMGELESELGCRLFARNHTKLVIFLGVVIFLLVGLYPPIRGYYHAVREHDELLLNQQKLEEDQKRLESEVQGLQTKEGIIDEAHKQGLVSGGEESARVEGLDKKKDENTVQHPDYPWYIKVGDFVFGFAPGDSGNTEAPKSANSDDSTSAPAPGESHEQKNSGEGGSSEGSGTDNSKSDSGNSH